MKKPFYLKNIIRPTLLGVTALILAYNFQYEIVQVNDGLGWDGKVYGYLTMDFATMLENHEVSVFVFKRLGLPVFIHYLLSFLGVSLHVKNVILAYKILNISLIIFSSFLYYDICKKFQWEDWRSDIGYVGMFWSFGILKFSMFIPVSIDTAAFTGGLAFLHTYFYGRKWLALGILAVCVWIVPTFILFGLLLVFDASPWITKNKGQIHWERFLPLLGYGACLIVSFAFFSQQLYETRDNSTAINIDLLPISMLVVAIYLYNIGMMTPRWTDFMTLWYKIQWRFVVGLMIIMMLQSSLSLRFGNRDMYQSSELQYLYQITKRAIINPGVFLTAHANYYGFLIFFLILGWKEIKQRIQNQGIGMLLLCLLIGYSLANSESRQHLNFFPLVAILIIDGLPRLNWRWLLVLVVFQFYNSYGWLAINVQEDIFDSNAQTFPSQYYWQFMGPWISPFSYVVHLLKMSLMVLILWFSVYKKSYLLSKH